MKSHIENILQTKIQWMNLNLDHLPFFIKELYTFYGAQIHQANYVIACPLENTNLTMIKKQNKLINNLFPTFSVFYYFDTLTQYKADQLMANQIPFIHSKKEIYLPNMGIVLYQKIKNHKKLDYFSTMTQKALIQIIYCGYTHVNASSLSKLMGISKQSGTRIFDELEASHLNLIQIRGRTRYFVWNNTREDLWKVIFPYLKTPVKKEVFLLELPLHNSFIPCGMTALSCLTTLNDNNFQTWGTDIPKSFPSCISNVIDESEAKFKLSLLRYRFNGQHQDPLSAYLSLSKEDQFSPRTEIAMRKIWEEIENGQWTDKI